MIEPNCDMPWDIYLDWLQDQGNEDLRFIDPFGMTLSYWDYYDYFNPLGGSIAKGDGSSLDGNYPMGNGNWHNIVPDYERRANTQEGSGIGFNYKYGTDTEPLEEIDLPIQCY